MKTKQICQVSPFLFDNHLLVSLDQKWIDVFGKIPTFSVTLDNEGRLNLCTIEQINKGKIKNVK